MIKLLKTSVIAVVLAVTAFSANAKTPKMTIADCNTKCTAETGKTGSLAELKACKGCPGSEVGDVALAAAEAHACKEKANHKKPECQLALHLGGKWFLDVGNDQTPTGEELRKLVVKADAEDK